MDTIINMFKNFNVAIVATDANYEVIYQNERCRQLFNRAFGTSDYIGRSIHDCHKAETMEEIKTHYQEYAEKTRKSYHYIMDKPEGKLTIVNIPFYGDDGAFSGVVEFMFEGSLA